MKPKKVATFNNFLKDEDRKKKDKDRVLTWLYNNNYDAIKYLMLMAKEKVTLHYFNNAVFPVTEVPMIRNNILVIFNNLSGMIVPATTYPAERKSFIGPRYANIIRWAALPTKEFPIINHKFALAPQKREDQSLRPDLCKLLDQWEKNEGNAYFDEHHGFKKTFLDWKDSKTS